MEILVHDLQDPDLQTSLCYNINFRINIQLWLLKALTSIWTEDTETVVEIQLRPTVDCAESLPSNNNDGAIQQREVGIKGFSIVND